MAECDWIILCDQTFLVVPGKLALVGIFDVMFAPDVPFVHDRLFIGFSIIGEPGESIALKLEIIGPTGAVIMKHEDQIILPDPGSMQVAVQVKDLKLTDFGRHAIQIDLDGQSKSAWFTLTQLPKQPPG